MKKKNCFAELQSDTREINLGDEMLRKNQNFPDEPDEWIKFTVNESYIQLMDVFPKHFRFLDGSSLGMVITL